MKSRHAFTPEQILTAAGLSIIVAGCVSSIFDLIVNHRFATSPSMTLLYLPYLILLGGGFAAGYFLSLQNLFTGVFYGFVAVGIFFPIDSVRAAFGSLPFTGFLFTSLPLIILVITGIIAFFTQYREKMSEPSLISQHTLTYGFGLYIFLSLGLAISVVPWYILLSPVSIWIVSYAILKTRNTFDRMIQSFLIAQVYFLFPIILSKFQINPANEVVTLSMPIIIGVSLLASILIAIFIRREQSTR